MRGDREGRALSWMWARGAPRVLSHGVHALKLAEWTIARACSLLPGCPVPHSLIHPAWGSKRAVEGLGSAPGPSLLFTRADLDSAGSHSHSGSPVAWSQGGWGEPPE